MHQAANRHYVVWGVIALGVALAPALAEMATVHLKDGTVMRGDVELTEAELLIRNQAGVVRCQRERVDHINWLEPAKTVRSEYMRRFWGLAPNDVNEHFALAEWLVEQKAFEPARGQCEYVLKLDGEHHAAKLLLQKVEAELAGGPDEKRPGQDGAQQEAAEGPAEPGPGPPGRQRYKGVPPPPPLSPPDILKLKLSEIALDGPAERLTVRFRKQRGARDVEALARQEMVNADDYDPDWAYTLERGRPHEKLQVILKATGLKYADRIEIRGDPRVFATYRRRVLPLVTKGCTRSGCHGGYAAHAFRFPSGPQTSDGFVYTSFLLLDRMQTAAGPMIDRALPEQSVLLRYLLPAAEGRQLHSPVKGRSLKPVLRGTRDPRYEALVDWIDSLRSPHPDYELEYQYPDWFEPLANRQRGPLILGEPPGPAGAGEKPPEDKPEQDQPADNPHADDEQKHEDDAGDEQP